MHRLAQEILAVWKRCSRKNRASSGQNNSKGNFSRDYNTLLQSSWLLPTRNFHDMDEERERNCPRSGLCRGASQWGWNLSNVGVSWAGASEQWHLFLPCGALWSSDGSRSPSGIRKHPSSGDHDLRDHSFHHRPGWNWCSNLEKKVMRTKRSHVPTCPGEWGQLSLLGAMISVLRHPHAILQTQRGIIELSICDRKIGATDFSSFFGSRRAVNF